MTAPLLLVLDEWFTWWHVLITTQRPLFWWNSESHLFLFFIFLLPLKKKQISVSILGSYYTYYEITTHTADCTHGYGVGVTESVHTWQCFLLRDASGIQWRMEFPQDSPFVSQEAADKFGSNMLSQERHATDSSSSILFTDWAGESESEQPAFITPAHGNSQCVWSCLSHIHTLCLSHRDTFKGACQSRRK